MKNASSTVIALAELHGVERRGRSGAEIAHAICATGCHVRVSEANGINFLLCVVCPKLNGLLIYLFKGALDMINLFGLEIGLPALSANPGWNCIPCNVVSIAIRTKWSHSLLHLAFAVQAFHQDFLVLKSASH
jgi:hypothetical protein